MSYARPAVHLDRFVSLLRRMALRLASVFISSLLLAVGPSCTLATTIVPLSWQQLVDGAGFVGIVECTKAGGIVAEYRVVESWKGQSTGSVLRIRIGVNYWEPQFPTVFVGERFLVTAFKNYDPTTLMSTTSGGPVPLWWRNIPAEYSTPLFQGMQRLPLRTDDRPLSAVGSERKDLVSFKKDVQEFLTQPVEARELALLKKMALPSFRQPDGATVDKERSNFEARVKGAASVAEVCSAILDFESRLPDGQRFLARYALSQGGAATLKFLQENADASQQLSPEARTQIIQSIQWRLGIQNTTENKPDSGGNEKAPSAADIAKIRNVFANHPNEKQFLEVFEVATRNEPDLVADYLVRWEHAATDWHDHDLGYTVGSYYAKNCARNRVENFKKLLGAKDAFVRVAAAVYLLFEDKSAGLEGLKRMSALPGDPGAWAALVLAERGDKEALPRALEMLSTTGELNMAGAPHRNLQKRLAVLLSNSAMASHIDQPPNLSEFDAETESAKHQMGVYEAYRNWWNSCQKKITLTDPWLETLDKQKVD